MMRQMNLNGLGQIKSAGVAVCLAWLTLSSGAGHASASYSVIAKSGEAAPGSTRNFGTYFGFSGFGASINASGDVAFSNLLSDGNTDGVWSSIGGTINFIAKSGDAAADTPYTFGQIGPTHIQDDGDVSFIANLDEFSGSFRPTTGGDGLWQQDNGTLGAVAYEGAQAAGMPAGANTRTVFNPDFAPNGALAFRGSMLGTGISQYINDTGLWSSDGSTLALNAQQGTEAVGTQNLNYQLLQSPAVNSSGQIAFTGSYEGTHPFDPYYAVWSAGSGTLTRIANEHSTPPGFSGSVRFDGFSQVRINDAGQTSFRAGLTGPGISSSNDIGIWSDRSGTLDIIYQTSDPSPGTGSAFRDIDLFTMNQSDEIALVGQSTNNVKGIWAERSGTLQPIVLDDVDAPGFGAGVTFVNLLDTEPLFNSLGQVVFEHHVQGPGLNSNNNRGIWVNGTDGETRLLLRQQDYFEVGPGDFRKINFFTLGEESLNEAGELALTLTFDDFSGAVVRFDTLALESPGVSEVFAAGAQTRTLPGGSNLAGRVSAQFDASEPGVFDATYTPAGLDDFLAGNPSVPDPALAFTIVTDPDNDAPLWTVDIDAVLNGPATLTFNYDQTLVGGIDETELAILHYVDGTGWVVEPGVVDTELNSITIQTDLFSPFILAVAPPDPLLDGDLNGDGFVGVDDLNIVLLNWNQNVTPGELTMGDATGEGFVGVDDLNIVLVNWNNGTPPVDSANIPEPAGVLPLGVGGVVSLLCRSTR